MYNPRPCTATKQSSEAVSLLAVFSLWYGLTVIRGLGKTIRDGMGQASNRPASRTLDLVITNALIVDWSGIYKVRTIPPKPVLTALCLSASSRRILASRTARSRE